MSKSYAASKPANIEIVTDDFNSDLINSIQHMNGVAAVEGRRVVNLQARVSNGQWLSLTLIAVSDFNKSNLDLLVALDRCENCYRPAGFGRTRRFEKDATFGGR